MYISTTLSSIDTRAHPPTMTICFPGVPHRFVTVRILASATTENEIQRAAVREYDAFDDSQVELLYEVAKPIRGSYGTSTWRPTG